MSLSERFRTMDKSLRLAVIATALLVIPEIGQLSQIRDINAGTSSSITLFWLLLAVFLIPSSVILSLVLLWVRRTELRSLPPTLLLCLINLLIALNLVWFMIGDCSWAMVFGLHLNGCK